MKWFFVFAFLAIAYAQDEAIGGIDDGGLTDDGGISPPGGVTPPGGGGIGSTIGKEILGSLGNGLESILGSIKEEMDKDQSKWIKEALAGSSNAASLLELFEMIKNGDLVVPSKKRGINIPSKEEILAKLTEMYENIKVTIDEHTNTAKSLFEQALAKLKEAYGKILENEKVQGVEEKVKEAINSLIAKAKEIAGAHKRDSQALRSSLHKRLVEHLDVHFSPEMSQRAARSVGSVIDAAIAKLEEAIQKITAKVEDKTGEFKEKYLTPLLAKFEELKNSPGVLSKIQGLRDLYQDLKEITKQLISGNFPTDVKKRSIGSIIDAIIDKIQQKLNDIAAKIDDKTGQLKVKYIDPLIARFEELKNSPALADKFSGLRELYHKIKELAREMIRGTLTVE